MAEFLLALIGLGVWRLGSRAKSRPRPPDPWNEPQQPITADMHLWLAAQRQRKRDEELLLAKSASERVQ